MELSAQEFSDRLQELYGSINDLATDTLVVSGNELVNAIKNRISNEGLNSEEASIGSYSTKPIYASQSQFVSGGFNPQGKNNKFRNTIGDKLIPTVRLKTTSVKKNPASYKKYSLVKPNYQQRKTMYLQQGYKELRDVQGLRTDVVNETYSGAMLADFHASQEGQTVLIGFSDEKQIAKRKGQTNKFGPLFTPSVTEIENYKNRTNYLISRLTRGITEKEGITAVATIE